MTIVATRYEAQPISQASDRPKSLDDVSFFKAVRKTGWQYAGIIAVVNLVGLTLLAVVASALNNSPESCFGATQKSPLDNCPNLYLIFIEISLAFVFEAYGNFVVIGMYKRRCSDLKELRKPETFMQFRSDIMNRELMPVYIHQKWACLMRDFVKLKFFQKEHYEQFLKLYEKCVGLVITWNKWLEPCKAANDTELVPLTDSVLPVWQRSRNVELLAFITEWRDFQEQLEDAFASSGS